MLPFETYPSYISFIKVIGLIGVNFSEGSIANRGYTRLGIKRVCVGARCKRFIVILEWKGTKPSYSVKPNLVCQESA